MKLFVLSDIHGYYTQMASALEESKFDAYDNSHLLICCGDLFDRGMENIAVLDYFEKLPHKVLIRGNHEDHFLDALTRGSFMDFNRANCTDSTFFELAGTSDEEKAISERNPNVAHTKRLVMSVRNYYETEHYVFVHAWVPLSFSDKGVSVYPNWRRASDDAWEEARELEWQQTYAKNITLPDNKIIVCGHRPSRLAHLFDHNRFPDDSTPFYGKGMIAIDAGTYLSGRVNVLVLEDELLSETSSNPLLNEI